MAMSCGAGLRAEDAVKPTGVAPSPEAVTFFETKIRPVFVEHCQECHGPDKQKGSLRVDSLEALATGGDSGPSLEIGDPSASLLMTAIEYEDAGLRMPPKKKLADAQIADIRRWIKQGAPWPKTPNAPGTVGPTIRKTFEITDEDRKYWAYQPVKRPEAPTADEPAWNHTDIDRLVFAKLKEKGLAPNGPATKRELIRRAYFDLVGLPPAPEAIDAFVANESPEAFAKLIDELLARPEYGERWGRYWLDLARFAQTNGYEFDEEKPYAWRYRDYVISAFNQDKPYSQFIIEQLAGDELQPRTDEAVIATGFHRVGTWDREPDDPRAAEFDNIDDLLVTTSAAFLGSTIGCARCHDHKLDPFAQADYYKLVAVFRNMRAYEGANESVDSGILQPLGDSAAIEAWREAARKERADLEEQLKAAKTDEEKKGIREKLERVGQQGKPKEWTLAAREKRGAAPTTHVLVRGNAGQPAAAVSPGLPIILGGAPLEPALATPDAPQAGLRLAFARWVASPENPLTPRVAVNRLWQHHFGAAIVPTTTDFGRGGLPPTHPELLDWLAAEFVASGGSMKRMHRTIMNTATYRMSSRADNAKANEIDPANQWLWRQNLRRLEAEAVRDSLLSVAGHLNPEPGGRGFFPHLSGEVLAGQSRPGNGWEVSTPEQARRRSVYAFVKRSVLVPLLEMFDYSNVNQPTGERQVTTVAPQALMMLNDAFVHDQAAAFAARVSKEAGEAPVKRIERAYRLATGRAPSDAETSASKEYLDRLTREYARHAAALTFRPDVSDSLHRSYLSRLKPHQMLVGPERGWSYHPGRWVGNYEGIAVMDTGRGPFALSNGVHSADGELTGHLNIAHATEMAGLLFRATVNDGELEGYELLFSPRDDELSLVRVGREKITELGKTRLTTPPAKDLLVRIVFRGNKAEVFVGDGGPKLVADLPDATGPGDRVGVRALGAAIRLDGLTFHPGTPGDPGTKIDLARVTDTSPPPAAPLPGWTSYGGDWSFLDDGGYQVRAAPGAKLVWDGPTFSRGTLTAEFRIGQQGGDVGFCVGVEDPADGTDALRAYNINIRRDSLRVGRHDNNWRQLAAVPLTIDADRWHHLRVEVTDTTLRIFLDRAAEPQLTYDLPAPLPLEGKLALRTFQADFGVKSLSLQSGDKTVTESFRKPAPAPGAKPPRPPPPAQQLAAKRAFETLCLTILNLNEVVYID
jgi:mono/diheme cytochrome c family protein